MMDRWTAGLRLEHMMDRIWKHIGVRGLSDIIMAFWYHFRHAVGCCVHRWLGLDTPGMTRRISRHVMAVRPGKWRLSTFTSKLGDTTTTDIATSKLYGSLCLPVSEPPFSLDVKPISLKGEKNNRFSASPLGCTSPLCLATLSGSLPFLKTSSSRVFRF